MATGYLFIYTFWQYLINNDWLSNIQFWFYKENTSKTEMLLDNLIPYTNYTATVDCIPLVRKGTKERIAGFWSDPRSEIFVTASDGK